MYIYIYVYVYTYICIYIYIFYRTQWLRCTMRPRTATSSWYKCWWKRRLMSVREIWYVCVGCEHEFGTGWRRLPDLYSSFSRQRDIYFVALLFKIICNLREPMSLRHPVGGWICGFWCEYVYLCKCIRVYWNTHTCIYDIYYSEFFLQKRPDTFILVWIFMYICIGIHKYWHLYLYKYLWEYAYVYMNMYTYIHIHIYIHIYIYICTCVHM